MSKTATEIAAMDPDTFRSRALGAASTVSLWPKWKRNALQECIDLAPRPVEVRNGLFTDIVPIEPGQYWIQNRNDPTNRVIAHLSPELGFDWTHYWMAGPRILGPEETAQYLEWTAATRDRL